MKTYLKIALLLPILLMLFGTLIAWLIPGCHMDEGAGASRACGPLGDVLVMINFGGLLWLIFGLFSLPIAGFIWLVKQWSSAKKKP